MIVDCALYRDGVRAPLADDPRNLPEVRAAITEKGDFVWVGLHDPTEEEIEDVAIAFGLHPLAVEDAVKAHQRPKLEHYEDSLFFTIRRSGTSTPTTPSRPARSTCSSARTSS